VLLLVVVRKLVLARAPSAKVAAVAAGLVVGGAVAYVTAIVLYPPVRPTGQISLKTCPNHNFIDSLLTDPDGNKREVFTAVSYGDIPEFHDCQKLITPGPGGAGEYGPTVAIFATTLSGQPPTASAPVIAIVFAMGGSYSALGIQQQSDQPYGINCLYLFDSSVGQHAKMVGPVSQDVKCSDTAIVGQPGTPLWVLASSPNPNVPAVARWDYDSSAKLNYIGIKCGDAWCEIGRDSSIKVSSMMDPSTLNPTLNTTVAVKGWYDQQLLAVPAGDSLKVSDVTGTLIPAPGLGALVDANFVGFTEVATAIVDKPYTKLDLEPGVNTVSLCKGTLSMCAPGDPTAPNPTMCPQGWWARIKSVSVAGLPKTTYHCVNYTEHTTFGANAPGTARWRWVDKDEQMWMRCSTGCCEVY